MRSFGSAAIAAAVQGMIATGTVARKRPLSPAPMKKVLSDGAIMRWGSDKKRPPTKEACQLTLESRSVSTTTNIVAIVIIVISTKRLDLEAG